MERRRPPELNNYGFVPMPRAERERLIANFKMKGGNVDSSTEALNHLKAQRAEAIFLHDFQTMVFGENPSRSAIREELIHFSQGKPRNVEQTIQFEIDAQNILISNAKKWSIPENETEITKRNLAYWRERMEKIKDVKSD